MLRRPEKLTRLLTRLLPVIVVGRQASVSIHADSLEEHLDGWTGYFEQLLNVGADDVVDGSQWEPENPFVDGKVHKCPITQQCVTITELGAAIKQMFKNKACGIDGITIEYQVRCTATCHQQGV